MTVAVDLVVLAIVAVAAVGGWRQGLTVVGLRWAGLLGGALIGWHLARSAPPELTPPAGWHWLFVAAAVGVLAVAGAALGGLIGRRSGSFLQRIHLGLPNRAAGAAARAAIAVVACWFAVSLATGLFPPNRFTDEAAGSVVLSGVDRVLGSPGAAVDRFVAPALR